MSESQPRVAKASEDLVYALRELFENSSPRLQLILAGTASLGSGFGRAIVEDVRLRSRYLRIDEDGSVYLDAERFNREVQEALGRSEKGEDGVVEVSPGLPLSVRVDLAEKEFLPMDKLPLFWGVEYLLLPWLAALSPRTAYNATALMRSYAPPTVQYTVSERLEEAGGPRLIYGHAEIVRGAGPRPQQPRQQPSGEIEVQREVKKA